jgi:hypothetical protein
MGGVIVRRESGVSQASLSLRHKAATTGRGFMTEFSAWGS